MKLLASLLWLGGLVLPIVAQKPAVPLKSSNRWILDKNNARVKLRCINWAGHMETNVPEGLHKQSINYIADWIAKEGFNCVRLTYSTEMALHQTLKVKDSFKAGAQFANVDEAAVLRLFDAAVQKNSFLADATLIDVFAAVQNALWDRGVMTILDNHVSKGKWCCNLDDGNGWWADAPGYLKANSQYFNTQDWYSGLEAMAQWSKGRPGVVGMSLRNELRAHITQIPWAVRVWKENMPRAGKMWHAANPDVLVIVGALNGGTDLSSLRTSTMDIAGWPGKNMWEAHMYSYTVTTPNAGNCDIEKVQYGGLFGFVLEQSHISNGPLFMSEFGVGMQSGDHQGLNKEDYDYLTCLVGYLERNDAEWAHWALQGSYYIREGKVDVDETWGALDNSWSRWRNNNFKGLLGKMWNVSQGP